MDWFWWKLMQICTDFCGNCCRGSENLCKWTICTDFCGNKWIQIFNSIVFARIFAEITLYVGKIPNKWNKLVGDYKNLQKMRENLPKLGQNSVQLKWKICTKWGNKAPKYDANSINFGDKNLSFGMASAPIPKIDPYGGSSRSITTITKGIIQSFERKNQLKMR